MELDIVWIIGLIGGLLLAVSYFPQIIKMWKRRHERFEEISLYWIGIAFFGSVLMFMYGFMIGQPSMVILNALCIFNYLFMSYIYQNSNKEV